MRGTFRVATVLQLIQVSLPAGWDLICGLRLCGISLDSERLRIGGVNLSAVSWAFHGGTWEELLKVPYIAERLMTHKSCFVNTWVFIQVLQVFQCPWKLFGIAQVLPAVRGRKGENWRCEMHLWLAWSCMLWRLRSLHCFRDGQNISHDLKSTPWISEMCPWTATWTPWERFCAYPWLLPKVSMTSFRHRCSKYCSWSLWKTRPLRWTRSKMEPWRNLCHLRHPNFLSIPILPNK